ANEKVWRLSSQSKRVVPRDLPLLTESIDVNLQILLSTPSQWSPFSLRAISATCRPWKRAISSSFSDGCRDPSPATVVAPYGGPPLISFMLFRPVAEYGTPTTIIPRWNRVV